MNVMLKLVPEHTVTFSTDHYMIFLHYISIYKFKYQATLSRVENNFKPQTFCFLSADKMC